MSFPALLDTNVLYGGYLCDFFLRLAEQRIYRPLWSETILQELRKNLLFRFEIEAVDHRLASIRESFPDALVVGYESLIPGMTCDSKDRHVLAAAVRGDAQVLVTFNLHDFPPASLDGLDIEAVHPDQFLLDQLDLYPGAVTNTLATWSEDCQNPHLSVPELLAFLVKSGVPEFATEAFRYLEP